GGTLAATAELRPAYEGGLSAICSGGEAFVSGVAGASSTAPLLYGECPHADRHEVGVYAPRVRMTSRLIAQMKADSSRAIAVAAIVGSLPLRRSERKRPHNRVCAFHAISRTRLGAAATFGCFSRPTRAGCR